MIEAIVGMVLAILGTLLSGFLVALLYQGCLWLGHKITPPEPGMPHRPYWQDRPSKSGFVGVGLFFFLLAGVPILVVLWGYATGRLPAH